MPMSKDGRNKTSKCNVNNYEIKYIITFALIKHTEVIKHAVLRFFKQLFQTCLPLDR